MAGRIAIRAAAAALIILISFVAVACNQAFSNAVVASKEENDPDDPTPGSGGELSVTTYAVTAVISWTHADDLVPPERLEYRVYYAVGADISTKDLALQNGTAFGEWEAGITSVTATGLDQDTDYVFTVLVRDVAGNMAAYGAKLEPTKLDTRAPNPPSDEIQDDVTVDDTTYTTASVSWIAGSDDITIESNLDYVAVFSPSNNITTLAEIDGGNGTLFTPWLTNQTSVVVTGLDYGRDYYFNVIIRDETGNRGIYDMSTVAPTDPDDQAPLPGGAGVVTPTGTTQTTIDIAFAKGSDPNDLTPQGELQYNAFVSTIDALGTFAQADANGTSITAGWASDIASASASSLGEYTDYFLNVFVRDNELNIGAYGTVPEKTLPYSRLYYNIEGAAELRSRRIDGGSMISLETGSGDFNGCVADGAGEEVFWAYHVDTPSLEGFVMVTTLDGGSPELVLSGLGRAQDVALNTATGDLYVTDNSSGSIYMLNKSTRGQDASALTPIVTGLNGPHSIDVDEAGKIYWTNYGGETIGWADLNGDNAGTFGVDPAEVDKPNGIAVDSSRVYWINEGTIAGSLKSAGLGVPDTVTTVISSGMGFPHYLTVEQSGASPSLYWTDFGISNIYKAPISTVGGDATSFVLTTVTNQGRGIDVNLVP